MLAETEWDVKFPNMKLKALSTRISDHTPITLELEDNRSSPKPFRCLDAWFSHPDFTKMVKQEWQTMGSISLIEKFRNLRLPLRRWNKDVFGNIDTNIAKFEKELGVAELELENDDASELSLARVQAIKGQLKIWYSRKELYWKQLSRDRHIKLGDRNSKYFHALAIGRKHHKQILQLRKGNRTIKNSRQIKREVVGFFRRLYSQEELPHVSLPNGFLPRISPEKAVELERMPSKEEIGAALKSCDSSKAPGYDGFNFNFLKKLWEQFEEEICIFISGFFASGNLPPDINQTWVALIPKIDNAVEVKDFRPISMVGCLYKLIAKILAGRLKLVMGNIVGESQSNFISDR